MAERVCVWVLSIALACAAVLLGWVAPPASACDAGSRFAFGVAPGCFDLQMSGPPTAADLAPTFNQAGGHPDKLEIGIRLNAPAEADPTRGAFWPPEPLRNLSVGLAPGLVANPAAVATCHLEQLSESKGLEAAPECAPASQVGTATIVSPPLFATELFVIPDIPLYNMPAPPGVAARFGLNLFGLVTIFDGTIPADTASGLHVELRNLTQALAVDGLSVALWGVPAGPGNDAERACPGEPTPGFGEGPSCPAGIPPRAFLRLPTSCVGPTVTSLRVDSWADPGDVHTASSTSHRAPSLFGDPRQPDAYPASYPGLDAAHWGPQQGLEACDEVPFEPSMAVRPTGSAAAEPTGLEVRVTLRQDELETPRAISSADLRAATIDLPAGLMVNASLANGLASCPAVALGLGDDEAPRCPDPSKLGTVEVESPVLSDALKGFVYFTSSQATPVGLRLTMHLVARSDAASVKLPVEIAVDGASGRATARLVGLPQLPIGRLKLHFFAGQRAPFVNPRICGDYSPVGRFRPWAGDEESVIADRFAILRGSGGRPCAWRLADLPLELRFVAGVERPLAGSPSALRLELGRADGQQAMGSFEISLPAGVSASLRKAEPCSEADLAALAARRLNGRAELAAPSCPASTLLGGAVVSVGSGAAPLQLRTGRIYLAGPHAGAPRSLAIAIPAVAGPVDLGTVVVRAGLTIDPDSGGLTLSGRLPTMQQGVPLNLRRIALTIDRPGFIVNPTNCRQSEIEARIGGTSDAVAELATPFQVHDCGALAFRPRVAMKVLGGREATRRAAHPKLQIAVRARRGNANAAAAVVRLPRTEQIDPARLRAICTHARFAAGDCPRRSRYGYVRAVSRPLGLTLAGPLYLRESKRGFPGLAAELRSGDGLKLRLSGRIDFVGGRVRIALRRLPDLPISRLALVLAGGRRGLLVNNRNLCGARIGSAIRLRGKNGKLARRHPRLQLPCRRSRPSRRQSRSPLD